MGIEIERKFLLADQTWRDQVERAEYMCQGYLQRDQSTAIRVRVVDVHAHINIKHTQDGLHRLEYEYPIPVKDAQEMLQEFALRPLIEKTRHYLNIGGMLWEIDEFHADNQGLIVAEIELEHADQPFQRPDWLGEEVTRDRRYYNSNLVKLPFNRW